MIIRIIITATCSLMFLMIGFDKFFMYLEPPCSLTHAIHPNVWMLFGVLQIAAGILIWIPKFRKPVAGFFFLFMLTFSIIHLINNTYDIGGSVFMAILLGLLAWNPRFLRGRKS